MESEMERIFEIRMEVRLSNRRKWITWRVMEKIWYAHGIWMVRENSSLLKYFKLQMRYTRVYRMFCSFLFPFSLFLFFLLNYFKCKNQGLYSVSSWTLNRNRKFSVSITKKDYIAESSLVVCLRWYVTLLDRSLNST